MKVVHRDFDSKQIVKCLCGACVVLFDGFDQKEKI